MAREGEGITKNFRRRGACKDGLGKHRRAGICLYMAVFAIVLRMMASRCNTYGIN